MYWPSSYVLRCTSLCGLFSKQDWKKIWRILQHLSRYYHMCQAAQRTAGMSISVPLSEAMLTHRAVTQTTFYTSHPQRSISDQSQREPETREAWPGDLGSLILSPFTQICHGSVPLQGGMCVLSPFKYQPKFASSHTCHAALGWVCSHQYHKNRSNMLHYAVMAVTTVMSPKYGTFQLTMT